MLDRGPIAGDALTEPPADSIDLGVPGEGRCVVRIDRQRLTVRVRRGGIVADVDLELAEQRLDVGLPSRAPAPAAAASRIA